MKKILGWFLVSIPFVAVIAFSIYAAGLPLALGIFAIVALIICLIFLGVYLITSND